MNINALRNSFDHLEIAPNDLFNLRDHNPALVIVDEVVGFTDVGAGPMAPIAPSDQITRMIDETDRLARLIKHKIAFRDSHPAGQIEAPYPPHCEKGTGHDQFTQKLAWLENDPATTIIAKKCINGVIGSMKFGEFGSMRFDRGNVFFDEIRRMKVDSLIFVGICTDICVLGPVLNCLSARTLGLLGNVKDIVVYEKGCATYDLSVKDARNLGLTYRDAHPADLYHAMALAIMRNQGAIIAETVNFI